MLTVNRILRSDMAEGTEGCVSIEGDLGSSTERGTE